MKIKRHITSIIMPMHDQLSFSKLALDSLYRNTNRDDFELICIDDASTDGTGEYLDSLEGVQVIHFKENVGFDRGVNAGIKIAKGEYTAILNNDLLLTPYWLPQLIHILESDPEIGIVVPACNSSSNYQIVYANYTNINELEEYALTHNHSDPMRWQERMRLVFYAALFRTRELKAFGGLDEQFSPGEFEDDDLSLRYRRAGYRLIFTTDTYIHHYGSMTISPQRETLLWTNRKKFYDKHKIHSWELTDILISVVDAYDFPEKSNLKLLGFGSKAGATIQYMKDMYMEKRRLVPQIEYLCKDKIYYEDALTICQRAMLYENRTEFFEQAASGYDVILIEDSIGSDEIQSLLKEYAVFLKPGGDLIVLLPKGNVIFIENEGYWLRYQKTIEETQFCVITRK